MMNRETFTNNLILALHELLGDGYTITHEISTKNNDTKCEGILIKSEDSPLAPNFFIDPLYQDYLGGDNIFVISRRLVRSYHDEMERRRNFNFSYFIKAYDRIAFRLVNTALNRELLEALPHRDFLDLSIVYYIPIPMDDETFATCAITYDLMEQMSLTESDLYELASANTPRLLEGKFQSMESLLAELAEKFDIPVKHEGNSKSLMYVVTNKYGINGASTILYDGFLKETLGGLGYDKFLMLPSSVHECIFVPYYKDYILEDYFNVMVSQVNKKHVADHEILAGHAYIYNVATGLFTVA
ncbi:MAG: hypothetical protein E7406_08835 [Ruminococcaceae bacterium]|nr:hypothetical protein [Oscillospiraceae bacterium]